MSRDYVGLDPWLATPRWPERKNPRLGGDDLVWHYTDRAGFEGIITTGTIWATSTDSLNDTGEGTFGFQDLEDYWADLRPNLKPEAPGAEMDEWIRTARDRLAELRAHVVCGCNTVDSLVHWRSYIGDDPRQGFAIGFEPRSEFRALTPAGQAPLYLPDFVPAMFWRDVTYGSHLDWEHRGNYWDHFKHLIDGSLNGFDGLQRDKFEDPEGVRKELDRQLLIAVLTSKHEAYESEDEARVLVVGAPGYSWKRTGRYGEQSVVTLTGVDEVDWELYSKPTVALLPVAKVMIGPWNDRSHASWTSSLLNAFGYDVPVERSGIPIR